ncbi:MAG: hypothetical protein JSW25_05380 [Thermoplasmata archaeon]|nr:MAG: hypothetical protein JSW25_05380 [Thermoplasmata archaeon]
MSWEDPDGTTSYVTFEYSKDGTRLLVVSHGQVPKVRTMGRDLEGETPVDLGPDIEYSIAARWSNTDQWAAIAWAHADGGPDRLTLFDTTTWERYDLFENETTPLEVISAFIFVARDDVLVLAGRDVNGTSRMLVFETRTLILLRDFQWRDNKTVRFMGYDSMDVQCVDDSGALTILKTRNWALGSTYHPFEELPTCLSVTVTYLGHPWTIGYRNGHIAYYHTMDRSESTTDLVQHPIGGVAWVWEVPNYYVVGWSNIDQDAENTRMRAYRFSGDSNNSYPSSEIVFLNGRSPTLMATDPLVEGQFLVGFTDGLAVWRLVVREDLPPVVFIDSPKKGQTIEGYLHANGRVEDDWNRTRWVKYQIDGGNWSYANGTEEWTLIFDEHKFGEGEHTLIVQAYDGTHRSDPVKVKFNVPETPSDQWPQGFPQVPCAVAVLIVAIIVMVRSYERKWRT